MGAVVKRMVGQTLMGIAQWAGLPGAPANDIEGHRGPTVPVTDSAGLTRQVSPQGSPWGCLPAPAQPH